MAHHRAATSAGISTAPGRPGPALTGGRIGYIRDYTVSPKHPSFAFQFNIGDAPGTDWHGGFNNIDSALSALEAVARKTYDALAQCEFKY